MKNIYFGIIWDVFFISKAKLQLYLIFQNFQNGRHFQVAKNFFLLNVIPEVEYISKIAMSISDILIFWSTL